uniref:Uncharacterized protein n=1 Tax=Romanomermis culicivorax TaxID=13658 RepID=A0A915KC18_ROMCU
LLRTSSTSIQAAASRNDCSFVNKSLNVTLHNEKFQIDFTTQLKSLRENTGVKTWINVIRSRPIDAVGQKNSLDDRTTDLFEIRALHILAQTLRMRTMQGRLSRVRAGRSRRRR